MADELKKKIREDLNQARRDRDRMCTMVLTTLLSDIRNREIETGHELSDEDIQAVVAGAIKRRHEAAEQMEAGGRGELAEKELRECVPLEIYLPPQLAQSEVRELVRSAIENGADNIGAVMGRVMPEIKGRFDGREANRIVREELDQT